MRQLELPAGQPPRAWGRIHGETFRGEIQALAAIRTYLCTKVGGFGSAAQVHAAAREHLPVLEAYHRGLYDELIGIAEGAAVSPEDIVIANHYTDLRDLDPDPRTWRPAPLADDPGPPPAGGKIGPRSSPQGDPQASGEPSGAGQRDATRGPLSEQQGASQTDPQASGDPSGAGLRTDPPGAGPRDATRGGVNGPAPPVQPPAGGKISPLSDDGCSVIWAESATGRILAQTWDMHATAIPYVMMLHVPESADGPPATLLSVTGCLGMAGMNAARVAIAINNLFSTDATLGVVWPAVVRRALHRRTAAEARDVIATSPIGSGHHYFVADRRDAYAIEASGTRRKQMFAGGRSYCHTNHCLDGEVAARSKVPPTSTTHDRMRWLEADLARSPIADLADAWRRLGSEDGWPRSICTNMATPEAPHGTATCGAIAMNLDTGELWAQQGLVHNVAAERWRP